MTALFAAGTMCVSAADPADASARPGMQGMVYRFFDDRTGANIGRLRIERVEMEYGRRGFLRVAWQPVVVLDGVTLEISSTAVWPAAGAPILDALRVKARDGAVLRNVTLVLPSTPGTKITSSAGRLRGDGALELTDAVVFDAGSPPSGSTTLCFWLSGPQAGKWTAARPPTSPSDPTFSTASHQPSAR